MLLLFNMQCNSIICLVLYRAIILNDILFLKYILHYSIELLHVTSLLPPYEY